MRTPSENDYSFEIEGVGKFTYGQRTIGDFIKIRRRFLELVGEEQDPFLTTIAGLTAVHEQMCVSAPEGWEDFSSLPMSITEDVFAKLIEIDNKVGEAENSFRKGAKSEG